MTKEELCYAIVFLTEALIACLYFDKILEQKKKNTFKIFSFLTGYFIIFLISLTNTIGLTAATFFCINFGLVVINYACKIKIALIHSAILYSMICISNILITSAASPYINNYSSYPQDSMALVAIAASSKMLFFFLTTIAANFFKPKNPQKNQTVFMILHSIMLITSAAIAVTVARIGLAIHLSGTAELLITISVLSLLTINLFVLVIYNYIQKMNAEHLSLRLSNLKDQAAVDYYKMLREQYENQRVLIHDIKNHLSVINGLANHGKNEEISAYLSDLQALPELKQKIRFCQNPILNSILLRYSSFCENNNIEFYCDIRADTISFLDATSITALFGNLMSNAVEAAEQSEEKIIELSVVKHNEQNIDIISIVNSCNDAPLTDAGGKFITRKKDSANHGFGFKSIERVIKRYNGSSKMYYNPEEKLFHCIIQLPIQK